MSRIKEGLSGRGKQFYPEALTCVSMLASAVGVHLVPYLSSLLPLVCIYCLL